MLLFGQPGCQIDAMEKIAVGPRVPKKRRTCRRRALARRNPARGPMSG
jgi:hypothetical protein